MLVQQQKDRGEGEGGGEEEVRDGGREGGIYGCSGWVGELCGMKLKVEIEFENKKGRDAIIHQI